MKIKGSIWRKWDLHLHSPFTFINNQYKITKTEAKEIPISFLKKDSFSKLFDKNPFENIESQEEYNKFIDELSPQIFSQYEKKIIIYKIIEKLKSEDISAIGLTNYFKFDNNDYILKEILEENGITTFLNLELRLSGINKDEQLFDYHIIFNNKLPKEKIESFLHNLACYTSTGYKFTQNLDSPKEFDSAHVSIQDVNETINSKAQNLATDILTGCVTRGHGSITSDSQPKNIQVYDEIIKNTDLVINSSDKKENLIRDRNYWLKDAKYIRPLIQSSDSHTLKTIGKKYTWIKSDTTFEGLKQIKYEPDTRVSIDHHRPDKKEKYLTIDKVKIKDIEIEFNENLNTIIGGRSTGKSLLLNTIAAEINTVSSDDNFTFRDIQGFEHDDFQVFWVDKNTSIDRKVTFLPQEYMINIAHNEDKFNRLIGDILKTKNYNLDIEKYRIDEEEILSNIRESIKQIKINRTKLSESLIKPEGDKKGIETTIDENNKIISDFNSDDPKTKEIMDGYNQLSSELANIKSKISYCEATLDDLANIEINKIVDSEQVLNSILSHLTYKKREFEINNIKASIENYLSARVFNLISELNLKFGEIFKELKLGNL